MNDLTGLSEFTGQLNIPGLITIEYVPVAWVNLSYLAVAHSPFKPITEVPLTKGDWLKAPTLIGKRLWTEKMKRTKQGISHEQLVTAIVPNLSPEGALELERMVYHRFLLRLKDANGVGWVLGTLETPFQFFIEGTSGDDGTRKQHRIRWQSETKRKAIGFIPPVL